LKWSVKWSAHGNANGSAKGGDADGGTFTDTAPLLVKRMTLDIIQSVK